jgi:aspartate/methionine/tyrosine aminotransferase
MPLPHLLSLPVCLLAQAAPPLRYQELEASLSSAFSRGVDTKAVVVINPGNPTGNSLPVPNMRAIISFCAKHNLVLMADEVYQENVYVEELPFNSFKKAT